MTRRLPLRSVLMMLALGLTLAAPLFANGGKAKNVFYRGSAAPGDGADVWEFTITTNAVLFYLGTVNNKYHVLLIRVRNNTGVPLNLARDQDTIELHFTDEQKVKGVLNLAAADPATWDSLEREMRSAVAYPEVVKPGEEEGIYLYVPVGQVKDARKTRRLPKRMIYRIKSFPEPIELVQPSATAAAAR